MQQPATNCCNKVAEGNIKSVPLIITLTHYTKNERHKNIATGYKDSYINVERYIRSHAFYKNVKKNSKISIKLRE